jgi:PAS domain S-box-containing protein
MKPWFDVSFGRNRLSYSLLFYILLASVSFTLVASAIQLYLGYRKDMKKIPDVMALIEESYLEPLETSLWSFDTLQMEVQARGILTLPLIKKVVVYELSGTQERQALALGVIEDDSFLEQTFPLIHRDRTGERLIGTLMIYAGLDEIGEQVANKALATVLMKVIEILILSLAILMIFRAMILRHLMTIERFLGGVDIEHMDRKLVLDRPKGRNPDILDSIVGVINRLIHQLTLDIVALRKAEENLLATNQELVRNRETLEAQDRLRAAQMDVARILRGDQDLESLAHRLIGYLCRSFNAGAGLFYHVNPASNRIRALAAYALAPDNLAGLEFAPGEGQVGQAVVDQRMRVIKSRPGTTLTIRSSLGQSGARQILIYPFVRDGRVTGVVEIGSFTALTPDQTALLDQISEGVAIALESAMVRTQKTRLIEEIEHTADALTVKDLDARFSEEKFHILFDGLAQPVILIDARACILDVNRVMLAFVGGDVAELQGSPLDKAHWWKDQGAVRQVVDRILEMETDPTGRREFFEISGESGRMRVLSIVFRAVVGDSGELRGMMLDGMFEDPPCEPEPKRAEMV